MTPTEDTATAAPTPVAPPPVAPPSTAPSRSAYARKARGALGRLTWGLADQGVASLTSFCVGIVVARALSAAEFGAFSLVWVTFGVAVNFSRGLATDPLVVRHSGAPTEEWRAAVRRSTGTAVAVGLVTGAACAATGLVLGGTLGKAFLALAVVMPGILLQNAWRFAFFSAGKGAHAFANDMVFAVTLVPFLWLAFDRTSVAWFVIAWGAAGAVAAVVGCLQIRLVPDLTGVGEWLSRQRDLGPRYLVENVSQGVSTQLHMYGVGAIVGLAAAGTIRGAELLLGPFVAVLMGVAMFAVPEATRVLRRSTRMLWYFCLGIGAIQAAGTLAWGLALTFLLPDSVGEQVLGPVWATASLLILPTTLAVMTAGFSNGATTGLRALGAATRSLNAQVFTSAAYLVFGVIGAAVDGAFGSACGCAFATLLGAFVWWRQLHTGLRDHERMMRIA
ncbi:MAG: hypothetical protein GEV10_14195 [Streptosporangiales bacterium]|nr:hypothetical protein [Streptosporangiales bacterium]